MKIIKLKNDLAQYVLQVRTSGKTIGLVPTMGALHQGHLSLIELARQSADIVACSIFVNPTQFNDPKDLEKYPRPITEDLEKLTSAGCDMVFMPDVTEMYADHEQWHLNIGELEFILEGEFRPGHYQGVTQVVYKLLSLVQPDLAFFGQKDYQQFMVISKMVELLGLNVKLVMCPILRDADGLAMSSRNIHLSATERQDALILSKTLFWLMERFTPENINTLQQEAEIMIRQAPGVELDYLKIVDGQTLHTIHKDARSIVALVAAKVGKTRLIDNVLLKQ